MNPIYLFSILAVGAVSLIGITRLVAQEIDYRRSIPLSIIPDRPKPFGYKMYWYALKTIKTQEVVEAFNLKNPKPINWEFGVEIRYSREYRFERFRARRQAIYVAPPVNGWTLVIGTGLPYLTKDESSDGYALFLHLSKLFGEAQFFDSLRGVDAYTWARAVQGKLIRAYSFGEYEEQMWDMGELTLAEKELGYVLPTLGNYQNENDQWQWPKESDVLQIAGKWSVNPGELDTYDIPASLGVLGEPSR